MGGTVRLAEDCCGLVPLAAFCESAEVGLAGDFGGRWTL